jgi:hypothetical protein
MQNRFAAWSCSALCLLAMSPIAQASVTESRSPWLTDYETARTVARLLDRPIFAVFA